MASDFIVPTYKTRIGVAMRTSADYEYNDLFGFYSLIEDNYCLGQVRSTRTDDDITEDCGFKKILTKKQHMLLKMGFLDEDLVNDVMNYLVVNDHVFR